MRGGGRGGSKRKWKMEQLRIWRKHRVELKKNKIMAKKQRIKLISTTNFWAVNKREHVLIKGDKQ